LIKVYAYQNQESLGSLQSQLHCFESSNGVFKQLVEYFYSAKNRFTILFFSLFATRTVF